MELELKQMKGEKMFSSFFEKLNSSQEYLQKVEFHPLSLTTPKLCSVQVHFSGEEVFGKYLDLHDSFQLFLNLPKCPVRSIDYIQYIDLFCNFFYMTNDCRRTKQYQLYLNHLWTYLKDFFCRIQPLIDLEKNVKDWEKLLFDDLSTASKEFLSKFSSEKDVMQLGMVYLKSELAKLGLKTGLVALHFKILLIICRL
jgi:splicing factor 3A subunit 3